MYINRETPFNERLKYHLNRKNLSYVEFAALMNVSRSTVSLWLSGKRNPTDEKKFEMCEVFEVNYLELIHTNEELSTARISFFFEQHNLDISKFERFVELEKELGEYFLRIFHKYFKEQ